MLRRTFLVLALASCALPPVRAVVFEGGASERPVVFSAAQPTAFVWSAAGLPALPPAVWGRLQLDDAALLHAGATLAERLETEPEFRARFHAAFESGERSSRVGEALLAVADKAAKADPRRLAQARRFVGEAAPQALKPSAQADLSRLGESLAAFAGSRDLVGALSRLAETFDVSRLHEGVPLAVSGKEGAGAPPLSPLASRSSENRAAPPAPHPAGQPAKKALGLIDLVGLGVNAIIGAGIFLKPAAMAGLAGTASVWAFPITAIILIPVALCFAEAATYFQGKDGGAYHYMRGAFPAKGLGGKLGEWTAFGAGWMSWISLVFGWAAITSVISLNLAYFAPALANPWIGKALAAGVIALISYVNYRGVKEGASVSNFFAAAKLIPMLLFVGLGLTMLHPGAFASLAPKSLASLSGACFMTFFALQGFESIAVPGGEVREPAKNLPRAVIISLLLASLIYAGIQVVCLGVLPGLASSPKPLVDGGFQLFGVIGAGVMALCAFFSTTGGSAAQAVFGGRLVKVLADDDHLPGSAQLRKVHPRFGTPHVAIAVTGALTIASLLLPIDDLMDVSSIAIAAQYVGTCLAIPLLRRRYPRPEGAFRIPGGMLVPILGAAAAMALSVAGGFGSLLIDFGFLGLGLALKLVWDLPRARRAA